MLRIFVVKLENFVKLCGLTETLPLLSISWKDYYFIFANSTSIMPWPAGQGKVWSKLYLYFCFPDCDVLISEGIVANNQLPFCHSETVAYTKYLSALVDNGDNNQGIISRNGASVWWDEYAGPKDQTTGCLLDV